jgi:hypothetical protein
MPRASRFAHAEMKDLFGPLVYSTVREALVVSFVRHVVMYISLRGERRKAKARIQSITICMYV